ncbi:hypothetical protein GQ44DRAFT_266856 [Phaeosphaeriaceae sp. PMI808]|nr:hypothetical protein GQ44DRAFT_266856 [Phaeosphaeriaceae sp. PMI808]
MGGADSQERNSPGTETGNTASMQVGDKHERSSSPAIEPEPVENGLPAVSGQLVGIADTRSIEEMPETIELARVDEISKQVSDTSETLKTLGEPVKDEGEQATQLEPETEQRLEPVSMMNLALEKESRAEHETDIELGQVEEKTQVGPIVGQAPDNSSAHGAATHNMAITDPLETNIIKKEHANTDSSSPLTDIAKAQPDLEATESLRSNPYAYAASQNSPRNEPLVDIKEAQIKGEHDQQFNTTFWNEHDQGTDMHDGSGDIGHNGDDKQMITADSTDPFPSDRPPSGGDNEDDTDQLSDDENFENDGDTFDHDDVNDFIAKVLQRGNARTQPLQYQRLKPLQEDVQFRKADRVKKNAKIAKHQTIKEEDASQEISKAVMGANPFIYSQGITPNRPSAYIDQTPSPMPTMNEESSHRRSATTQMLPNFSLQSLQQYTSKKGLNYPSSAHDIQFNGQGPSAAGYGHFSTATHMPSRTLIPPVLNDWPSNQPATASFSNVAQGTSQRPHIIDEKDTTDDDEPLQTRAPRHPFISSDSIINSSSLALNYVEPGKDVLEGNGFDMDFATSRLTRKGKVANQPPSTPVKTVNITSSALGSDDMQIDWALPTYEAHYEPAKDKFHHDMAKISIPGVVREELLLTDDHALQELHLLLNVFLPGQKALAMPDPAPAQAILNFHTVAVMVIEAFVQFEIGDEFGTGRGHWHNNHDEDDAEYQRLRNAKDADTDEIFFAVIDRWRAALESNKKPSKLIRGVQEFCDIALDITHYIKEHGLLQPEKENKAAKAAKPINRGARKVDPEAKTKNKGKVQDKKKAVARDDDGGSEFETSPKKGNKRGGKQTNTLEARKKAKIVTPNGRKSKKSEPKITVIKR